MKNEHYPYQDQLGMRIAARLSDSSAGLPSDITERLKAARMQALAKRKIVRTRLAAGSTGTAGGSALLHMGDDDRSIWNRIASLLPLFALIAGLIAISAMQDQDRAREIADVDAELLTDDLPPAAYTDPGFVHFLTVNRRD